jgi:hypothetical protein
MPEGASARVSDVTCARGAGVLTQSLVARPATSSPNTSPHQKFQEETTRRVVSRLNKVAWVEGLASHPDRNFADELVEYIEYGVPLLFDGPQLNQVYPNWASCDLLRDEVKTSLRHDISRGWKVGPFPKKPFSTFVGSSMGAFSKPSKTGPGVKTRVIHNLSWPPDHSVNTFIPSVLCKYCVL